MLWRSFQVIFVQNTGRIPELSHYDLEYLQKLINFLLKEYTRNFLIFIESNKAIDTFKSIKYNELNIVDEKLLHIIEAQMEKMKEQVKQ